MKNRITVILCLFSLATFSQVKKSEKIKVKEKEVKVVEIKSMQEDNTNIDAVPEPVASKQSPNENDIYQASSVEVQPEFPGGIKNFYNFISKNIVISEEMKSEKVKGKVYASFVVEKDGSISEVKVLRDFGYNSGKEALRVLKMMPKWIPAQTNGKKVRCTYTVPIAFDATK